MTTDVWREWSAQDHAGHLLDLEPPWMARVDDFLTDRDTLAVADLGNRKTHEANHNAQELAEIDRTGVRRKATIPKTFDSYPAGRATQRQSWIVSMIFRSAASSRQADHARLGIASASCACRACSVLRPVDTIPEL